MVSPSSGLCNHQNLSGVGLIVRNYIVTKLGTSPTCHSECIISLRLPWKSNQHFTLLSVYVPTLLAYSTVKTCLYSNLRRHLNSTTANYKITILGDFSARVLRFSVARKCILVVTELVTVMKMGSSCSSVALSSNTPIQTSSNRKIARKQP